MQVAIGGGTLTGQLLAGFLGSRLGWRTTYAVAAGLIAMGALLLDMYAVEPPRGGAEGVVQEPPPPVSSPTQAVITEEAPPSERAGFFKRVVKERLAAVRSFRSILDVTTNVLILVQGFPGTLPWGIIMVFFNDYFSQELGFSVVQVCVGEGCCFSLAVYFPPLPSSSTFTSSSTASHVCPHVPLYRQLLLSFRLP